RLLIPQQLSYCPPSYDSTTLHYFFFFSILRRPPTPTLFPYTTLFRSSSSPCAPEARSAPGSRPAPTLRGTDSRDSADTRISSAKDRKSTRLNSSHVAISYAVFCLKKKNYLQPGTCATRTMSAIPGS